MGNRTRTRGKNSNISKQMYKIVLTSEDLYFKYIFSNPNLKNLIFELFPKNYTNTIFLETGRGVLRFVLIMKSMVKIHRDIAIICPQHVKGIQLWLSLYGYSFHTNNSIIVQNDSNTSPSYVSSLPRNKYC